MVQRRPLVLSGNFAQEADDTDAVPILGSITYGSGLYNQSASFTDSSTADLYLAPQASGLIFVPDGGEQKLGDDGLTLISGQSAYFQSVLAQEGVAPASASGLEAQRIAVEALASGNQALLNNETALLNAEFALLASQEALASGADAVDAAENALIENGYAIASGEYALGSGIAANEDAVGALSSGNAALYALATNPFIDENALLGLIISLS